MPDKEYQIKISADSAAVTSGSTKAAESLNQVGEAGVNAGKKVEEGQKKSSASLKTGADILRGLRMEFPMVARAAELMANPVTAAIAAVAAGFAIWKMRVDALTATLSGVALKGVGPADAAKVNEMATAYENLAKAVSTARDAYNSAGAASDRLMDKLKAEESQRKRVLELQKAEELARLEMSKEGMSEADYATAKLGIEDRYAAAGVAVEERSRRQQLAEKARKMANLNLSAQAKLSEAAGIKVAGADTDKTNEAALQADAEAAKKEIADARAQLLKMRDYRSSPMARAKDMVDLVGRYGWGTNTYDWEEMETERISRYQPVVDRYNNFLKNKGGRDDMRARRSQLASDASREAAEAETIRLGLPADMQAEAESNRAGRQAAQLERNTRTAQAAAGLASSGSQLQAALLKNLENRMGVDAALVAKLAATDAALARLQAQLRHGQNAVQ